MSNETYWYEKDGQVLCAHYADAKARSTITAMAGETLSPRTVATMMNAAYQRGRAEKLESIQQELGIK